MAWVMSLSPEQFLKHYDKQKRGFLIKEDLPQGHLTDSFERVDANDDGKWDLKEIEAMYQRLRDRLGLAKETKKKERPLDRDVSQLLKEMDANRDGRISRAEAKGAVASAFDALDANRDGFLDRKELQFAGVRMMAAPKGKASPEPAVESITQPAQPPDFDALDLNADGRLTRDELKGTPYFQLFDAMDANKDGKVSSREFETFLKKQAEGKGKS
jgi:Ca2+-binding EF-hand superfamily protein